MMESQELTWPHLDYDQFDVEKIFSDMAFTGLRKVHGKSAHIDNDELYELCTSN